MMMRFAMMLVAFGLSACGTKDDGPRLRGAVRDPAGRPVVGATVTVGKKTLTTDAKGAFQGGFDGQPPALVEVSAPGYFQDKLEGPSLHFACDPARKSDCAITQPIELAPAPAADGVYVVDGGVLVPVEVKTLTHDGTAYAIGDDAVVKLPRSGGNLRLYTRGPQLTTVRQVEGSPPTFGEPRGPVVTRTLAITGGGEATMLEFSLPNYPDARWALGTFTDAPDAPGTAILDGHRAIVFRL